MEAGLGPLKSIWVGCASSRMRLDLSAIVARWAQITDRDGGSEMLPLGPVSPVSSKLLQSRPPGKALVSEIAGEQSEYEEKPTPAG